MTVNEEATRERTLELARRLMEPVPDFQPGDLVEWKEGLRNVIDKLAVPLVVMEPRLTTPLRVDGANVSSSVFSRAYDLKVLAIDTDGEAIEWMIDARRVKRVESTHDELLP